MSGAVERERVAPPLIDGRWADARLAPCWPPQDGSSYRVRRYEPHDVVQIWVCIDGVLRIGVLYEHADWGDPPRRMVRPFFYPVLRSGERDRWVWWQPDRMRLHSRSRTSTLEAAGPSLGDAVRYRPYPRPPGRHEEVHGHRLGGVLGQVRVGGAWRTARILARYHWSDGLETVAAHVWLPEPDWAAHVRYDRHYRWDPAAIRYTDPPPQ